MSPSTAGGSYHGGNRLITGVVLAVITFWLFAQTTLNIAPAMRADLNISESLNNIAVSITALFSGIFIVVAGSLADRLGRVRLTNTGLASVSSGRCSSRSRPRARSFSHDGTYHPGSFGRLHHARHARPDESLLCRQGAAARAQFLVHWFLGGIGCLLAVWRTGCVFPRMALDLLDVHCGRGR